MLGLPIDISPLDPLDDSRGVQRALHSLVSDDDVELARRAGMDPRDVSALREFASERFIIVVRCPRTPAQDGARRAKLRRPRPKTGAHRVVVTPRTPPAPPCDLMSVWKLVRGQPEKIRVVPRGALTVARTPFEATAIVLELNSRLVSRVRHVAQDDDPTSHRSALGRGDRFIAFGHGCATYLPDAEVCAAYYRRHGLDWPHDGPVDR
jgi:hypothetical protein